MGERVRYHGGDAKIQSDVLEHWKEEGRLVILCPEMLAGFGVPRAPSEIVDGDGFDVINGTGKVLKKEGWNATELFLNGAKCVIELIREKNVKFALLKSYSPSCGTRGIYSGQFNGEKKAGKGVTAAMLSAFGVEVYDETEIDHLQNRLEEVQRATDDL
jgi:uncharacterized protein YbbK (DUF523 family)